MPNRSGRVQPVSHRRARRVTRGTHDGRRDGRTGQTCVTQASAARPNDTVRRIVFISRQVPGAGGEHICQYMCPLALLYASLLLDSMYMIRYITPQVLNPRIILSYCLNNREGVKQLCARGSAGAQRTRGGPHQKPNPTGPRHRVGRAGKPRDSWQNATRRASPGALESRRGRAAEMIAGARSNRPLLKRKEVTERNELRTPPGQPRPSRQFEPPPWRRPPRRRLHGRARATPRC